MTFGEWWAIYNMVFGKTIKPLSSMELMSLEDEWARGKS